MGDYRKHLAEVMFLDNFTCVYCGKRGHDLALDHFISQKLGGPDCVQNLVAACKSCNSSKSDKAAYEWGILPRYGRFAKFYKGPQVITQPIYVQMPPKRTWRDKIDGFVIFSTLVLTEFLTALCAFIFGVTELMTFGAAMCIVQMTWFFYIYAWPGLVKEVKTLFSR